MIAPDTQYTKVDGSWIGYQIVGEGPIDLVYMTGVASNIETMWDFPDFARALERMASYSRLILFDPRGAGISDPIRSDEAPTWELLAQDARAVLEAAKSERTAILGSIRRRAHRHPVRGLVPRADLRSDPLERLRAIIRTTTTIRAGLVRKSKQRYGTSSMRSGDESS